MRHSSEMQGLTESQSKTKVYYWDGADIVAEQTDGRVRSYLRGINLLAGETDGMIYYYILNEHGDVTQLWGQSGTCKTSYEYDAFGNEWNPDKEDENPFRYCGEYLDLSSDTYYLRARNYDPTTSRMLSEDSVHFVSRKMPDSQELVDPLSLNLYTYCYSNPVLYCDPSGHSVTLAAGTITALSEFLPWLVGGVSTAMTSIGAAVASSWTVIGAIAIGIVINEANKFAVECEEARAWAYAQVEAKAINPNETRDNTAYVIQDINTVKIVYVGRTNNYSGRQQAHQGSSPKFNKNDFYMIPVATGLTKNESRALEQTLITAFTLEVLYNMINSISPTKWGGFYVWI